MMPTHVKKSPLLHSVSADLNVHLIPESTFTEISRILTKYLVTMA